MRGNPTITLGRVASDTLVIISRNHVDTTNHCKPRMEPSGRRLRQRPRAASGATAPRREVQSPVGGARGRDAEVAGRRRTPEPAARVSGVDALLDLMRVVPAPAVEDDEDGLNEENDVSEGSGGFKKPKRSTKKRKATHTIRNEEIASLSKEIALLSKRLAFRRGQALEAATNDNAEKNPEVMEHPLVPNLVLREAAQEQQLWMAGARSMVAEYVVNDYDAPAHCYIHLTRSLADRERHLHSIKLHQLRLARRYVLERSRCMDVTKAYGDGQRYINNNGDNCSLRYSILQLPGSLTVRQVFDVALFFTEHLEISFTDGAGCVTIRENDDNDAADPTLSQHRYLTTINPETLIEGNLMVFTHFDVEGDYGIVVTPFVDRDDLHPYRPMERIRQDITAVLLVTREHEQIIIRRLGYVRIHRNDYIPVSEETMQQLTHGTTRWGDALLKHAKSVYGV